jgi:hypothetical protein
MDIDPKTQVIPKEPIKPAPLTFEQCKETLQKLCTDLVGSDLPSPFSTPNQFNKWLGRKQQRITLPLAPPKFFHRVSQPLRIGAQQDIDDVNVDAKNFILRNGHGGKRPCGVSLFVPLGGDDWFQYAHQQMFSRFGSQKCFVSREPTIPGTFLVVDRLAIRTDCIFGAHVTLSVEKDDTVPMKALQAVAEPTTDNWEVCCVNGGGVQELQPVDDYDINLVLVLLHLVVKHSDKPEDCFLAAYYAAVITDAYHKQLFVEPEDESEPLMVDQALEIGHDNIVLSLVVQAADFLDKHDFTMQAYFACEAIICSAKEKFCPSLICYATTEKPVEIKNPGLVFKNPRGVGCGPKMQELFKICPSFEIMVGSLAVRTSGCPQNLIPLVTEILTDTRFLNECAAYCSLPTDSWKAVATFTGLASLSFSANQRIPRPSDSSIQVTVFALGRIAWKAVHPLNNALMRMTLLIRHQMQGPCKFFATHPKAGRSLLMDEICGNDDLAYDLLPKLVQVLQHQFPKAGFQSFLGAELVQGNGDAHLFMFSWSKPIQDELEQLVFDSCQQERVPIAKVFRCFLSRK